MKLSPLQIARYQYTPKLPGMLRNGIAEISVRDGGATQSVADQEKIAALFPNTYGKNEIIFEKGENTSVERKLTVGVILSGGQAPGGHNVISGLYDSLKAINPENVLIGFKGGPSGLLENDFVVFDDEYINTYAALASILLLIDYIGSPAGAADQLDNYSLTDVFVGICALDDGTEVFNVFFPGPDAERALGIMMIPDPGVANYAYYPLEGISASLYNTFLDTLLSDVCNTHKQIPVEDMSTAITLVLNALEE